MEEIINKAKQLNPDFDKLSTSSQLEFINKYIDKKVIAEDLEFYYDSFFEMPYSYYVEFNMVQ